MAGVGVTVYGLTPDKTARTAGTYPEKSWTKVGGPAETRLWLVRPYMPSSQELETCGDIEEWGSIGTRLVVQELVGSSRSHYLRYDH